MPGLVRWGGVPTEPGTSRCGRAESGRCQGLVTELVDELARGHNVVVHCRMGIGRSSLVAAGALRARGRQAPDAWAAVSAARGEVPDTPEQRHWLAAAMALG